MKILVLDLDETLVFASLEPQERVDLELVIGTTPCFVQIRPGLEELVASIKDRWRCLVWSTGQPAYVEATCKALGIDWMELWARDRCRRLDTIPEQHHEPFDKPLVWVEPDETSVVIVDNAPGSFACNPKNGIPIQTWRGERADRQLVFLADYLGWLVEQPDVRRDHWKWATEVLLLRNAGLALHG